jgi:adenine-specific DNA methylase
MSNDSNRDDRPDLKIEGSVPIRAVGIETQRERKNYSDLPPQNYVHVWWARRPTPATRLAVLGSVLPETIDDDQFLRWIGMDPRGEIEADSVAEHVRHKKETKEDRGDDTFVYEHYGYRKAYKNLPEGEEMERLHDAVRSAWDGELPTVLDATAGGGSIPFESVRYGFPTVANELNPVASVILKAVLEHPRVDGDLSDDIRRAGEKINQLAREKLSEYFPNQPGEQVLSYLWANTITCPDCGLELPLAPQWWLDKKSGSKGIAARPRVSDSEDKVSFEIVELPKDVSKSEFNPTDGTQSRGKATCLRCGVVIDGEELRAQGRASEMGEQLYAVEIQSNEDRVSFRAPLDEDREAVKRAEEYVDSNPKLSDFLGQERYVGLSDRTANYGVQQWRDMYTPRQLLTHHVYLQAFQATKEEIRQSYAVPTAQAILTFLAIAADKAVDYSSRLSFWDSSVPKVAHVFDRHDFVFKWSFAERNLIAPGLGYEWGLDSTVEVYEEFRELSGHSDADTRVLQGDARDLDLDDGEVDAVVLDPPYYDNVMYAELSDFFYVWLREYLGDVYPDFFEGELTNKTDEAVANPAEFEDVAGEDTSKQKLAERDYERKMTGIFEEMHRVLDDDGVFTMMFTHKKTEAWDVLTTALIEAGFTVKATHPVSTESRQSLHQAGKNAAESTILLVSEKRDTDDTSKTLWEDVRHETRKAAREQAEDLDEREVEFTKVDMILAAFGPTLQVFTEHYPVVDRTGEPVRPQQALDEARNEVSDYFVDRYLNEGVRDVDTKTEWYLLAWLVFEAERFPFDEANRLAIGLGESMDDLKKPHKLWRKKSGDVLLRDHADRVRDINKSPDDRSSHLPIDPEALSFDNAIDRLHAALHVQDQRGGRETLEWLQTRNCADDPSFGATLEALLRLLPHDHDDWQLARDLVTGDTGEYLDLDIPAEVFVEETEDEKAEEMQGSLL